MTLKEFEKYLSENRVLCVIYDSDSQYMKEGWDKVYATMMVTKTRFQNITVFQPGKSIILSNPYDNMSFCFVKNIDIKDIPGTDTVEIIVKCGIADFAPRLTKLFAKVAK